VRTTIDLPPDIHEAARALAHERHQSLSTTVVQLLRQALGDDGRVEVSTDPATGLPVVRVGRIVTSADVRALDDE
jgi:predicted transcriptional regulator